MPATSSPASADAGPGDSSSGEELRDFEEIQSNLEEVIPPPKRHQPTELPEPSSTSDVAFPVIESEPSRPPP